MKIIHCLASFALLGIAAFAMESRDEGDVNFGKRPALNHPWKQVEKDLCGSIEDKCNGIADSVTSFARTYSSAVDQSLLPLEICRQLLAAKKTSEAQKQLLQGWERSLKDQ